MNLEIYIKKSFPNGLTYNETAQLCLHLYISSENVPEEMHSKCIKDDLAVVFTKLAKDGFIKGDHLLATNYGSNFHHIFDKGHWVEVIASIFKIGDVVDDEINESLFNEFKLNKSG